MIKLKNVFFNQTKIYLGKLLLQDMNLITQVLYLVSVVYCCRLKNDQLRTQLFRSQGYLIQNE